MFIKGTIILLLNQDSCLGFAPKLLENLFEICTKTKTDMQLHSHQEAFCHVLLKKQTLTFSVNTFHIYELAPWQTYVNMTYRAHVKMHRCEWVLNSLRNYTKSFNIWFYKQLYKMQRFLQNILCKYLFTLSANDVGVKSCHARYDYKA